MFKFRSCQRGLGSIFTLVAFFALCAFHVGCEYSSGQKKGVKTTPTTGIPKNNPDKDFTLIVAQAVDDENVENFKISGTCHDGGGSVSLSIGSFSRTAPCTGGVYKFVVDLTQLTLRDPVIITVAQTVDGQRISQRREVPQGYRVDAPPPENPIVPTEITLVYPKIDFLRETPINPLLNLMVYESEFRTPTLKVNDRYIKDLVGLYSSRSCRMESMN